MVYRRVGHGTLIPVPCRGRAVAPEALLVIYSDGMTEPENARGEAFGAERLAEVAQRFRQSPPRSIASAMLKTAGEWSASAEQADDMTVVVARFSESAKSPLEQELGAASSAPSAFGG